MSKEHHRSNYQLGKIMGKAWQEFSEEKRTSRARLLLSEGIPEGAPLMGTFDNIVKEKFPDILQEEIKEKLQELADFTTSANKLLDLVKKGQLEFGHRGPLGWQAVSLTQNSLVSIIVLDCNRENPINSSMIITFEKDTLEVEINNFRNAEQNSVGIFLEHNLILE